MLLIPAKEGFTSRGPQECEVIVEFIVEFICYK